MTTSADLLNSLKIDRSAPPPPPSRKGLWIGLAVAGVAVLAAAGVFALRGGKGVEVSVAEATAIGASGGGSASVLDATGYVVARRMATVSAKVTGKVREVLIEEGQQVEAGQVLAHARPGRCRRPARARRLAAGRRAQPDRQRAGAAAAKPRPTPRGCPRWRRSSWCRARSTNRRWRTRDALRAQLATAQRNAQVAGDGLRIADNGVDNTIVRAPFAGVVIAKAAQPGEIVSPLSAGGGFTRTGIGTIVDMDSLEVEVDVGEAFIGRVKPGMPVEAIAQRLPGLEDPRPR